MGLMSMNWEYDKLIVGFYTYQFFFCSNFDQGLVIPEEMGQMSMNWGYVACSAGNLAHSQLIYQRYGLTTRLSPFKFAFIVSSFLLLCNKKKLLCNKYKNVFLSVGFPTRNYLAPSEFHMSHNISSFIYDSSVVRAK